MTGQKRCCATCRFFQDMDLSGNGWCTHPKRKVSSDVKILVRKGELACRNSWGGDYWADAKQTASEDSAPDSIAANGAPLAAEHTPSPMWLPGAAAESNDAASRPVRRHDNTFNAAAHLEQEERAEVMRRSPRDAILRARERSVERKLGRQRTDQTPIESPPSEDEAEDRIVANQDLPQTPLAAPEGTDRVIRQDTTPESPLATSKPVPLTTPDRIVASPVPISEVINRPGHSSESKFNTIPEIKPDVELPRLRNQFRLPGQRGNTRTPSQSEDASGDESTELSAYDRALQRAREFRTGNAPTGDDDSSPVDLANSAPTWAQRAKDPSSDGDEDEVVSFQVDRSTRLSRFADDTIEHIDDIDETSLEEDYELERSYRPETNPNQSGHRWWHTFARHRVFRSSPREESAPLAFERDTDPEREPAFEDDPGTDIVVEASRGDAFDIQWDSESLTTRALRDDLFLPEPANRTEPQTWPSLDYLPAEADADAPLEPLEWREEELVSVDTAALIEPLAGQSFWDLSHANGMDQLRERLFGRSLRTDKPSGNTANDRPEPASLRAAEANPNERFEAELPSSDYAASPDREIERHRTSSESTSVEYGYDSEFNPDFDLRRLVASEVDPPLDMRIMISPEIPRKCATCRDFRPSENGSRGWCTNNWAFPHRPLVNADDLACDSTIGCWWLPAAEGWDEDAFYARLAAYTPRTDRLEAQLYGETQRIRRSM